MLNQATAIVAYRLEPAERAAGMGYDIGLSDQGDGFRLLAGANEGNVIAASAKFRHIKVLVVCYHLIGFNRVLLGVVQRHLPG
ncbi:MAG: hypothetical protein ACI9TP_002535, partial [Candidatus Azotimanducaceae bacterium]